MADHYAEGQSPRFRKVVGTLGLALVGVLVALCAYGCDVATRTVGAQTYEEAYVPGQPLDAVRLSAPTFAEGEWCYKVADRTSGACWWLVKVDGEWQVLTVCEGHSYVQQQQEEAAK